MAISKITTSGIAGDTLTAADIADDAIGTAELANDVVISTSGNITTTGKLSTPSIVQTDAQNLSGTYSTHEIIMGKTFTATGDLTVNTNLVLVNMSGTGDDVTIQDDGTATTITGTGTLESGNLLTKEKFDLTNMTGALGSAVTGGAGLMPTGVTSLGTVTVGNLSHADIVYPAGHVIQVDGFSDTTEHQTGDTDWSNKITAAIVITPKIATSNMFLTAMFTGYNNNSSGTWHADFYKNSSSFTETYNLSTKNNGLASQQGSDWAMATIQWLDLRSENDTNAITYTISFRAANNTASIGGNTNYVTTMYAFEIMA